MSESIPQKIALGFAILAFAFMVFGSVLSGARFVTALIRGFEGSLVFGGVAWALSRYLLNKLRPEPKDNNAELASETSPQTEKELVNPL